MNTRKKNALNKKASIVYTLLLSALQEIRIMLWQKKRYSNKKNDLEDIHKIRRDGFGNNEK